jgi:cytochrome P450
MALIIAGSDTLTTALAATINNLLRRPETLQILVNEYGLLLNRTRKSMAGQRDPLSTSQLSYRRD